MDLDRDSEQPFFSLKEAKRAVHEKLDELNERPFEPAVWSTATVQADYFMTYGINKYTIPFELIGENVDVRMTVDSVEAFLYGNRVASHVRRKNPERDPIRATGHMHQMNSLTGQDSSDTITEKLWNISLFPEGNRNRDSNIMPGS